MKKLLVGSLRVLEDDKMKFFLLIITLFISSCGLFEEPKITVRVPLPEETVENILRYFRNLDPRNQITVKYVPFDIRLDSHPRISGYLEITGPADVDGVGYDKETMIGFINGLKSQKLLPVENYYWDRDGNEFRWLEDRIHESETKGIKQQYIILKENELRVVYKE